MNRRFLRVPRRPTNWRRLQQLTARSAASGDIFRTESGMWVTARAEHVRQILVTESQRYRNQSAFVRVDHQVQLPAGTRKRVVRELVGVLNAALPVDWDTVITAWVGEQHELTMPGWGMRFLRHAFATAIACQRSPQLTSLIDVFVDRNLVRHSTQGRYGLRSRHRIQALGRQLGELITSDEGTGRPPGDLAPRGLAPVDLVDVVANVPDLAAGQRGELLLRLVTAVVGATGVALEWTMIHVADAMVADPAWQPTVTEVAALAAEAQRVHPTSWLIMRQATEDHQVGGCPIAAGEHIAVLTYALHRAADSWPEPDTFNPTRWATEAPEPGAYVPFAAGRTTCPGRNIAIQAIIDATVQFAARYRLVHRQRRGAVPNVRTLFAPPDGTLHLTRRP